VIQRSRDRVASAPAGVVSSPRTILLVPFADGIGDFVTMLPIVEAVCRRYPNATISVAASEHAELLLPDGRVQVRTPSWLRRPTSPTVVRYRWLISQRLVAALSDFALRRELGRFDLSINLFRTWERGMPFSRDWTPQVPARAGATHSLDFLAEQLDRWDVALPPARRTPRIAVRAYARDWAARRWHRDGLADRAVVGLVPASNMTIKQWPLERWAGLNDDLNAVGLRTVLFTPGPAHPANRLLDLSAPPPVPIQVGLDYVAAALERCSLVVAVDTGLLHMAAAVGTPYVGLFGPTNPLVTGPYDRSLGVCLVAPYPKGPRCRGCWKSFKYENDRCAARPSASCAALLDDATVFATALAVLERSAHPRADERRAVQSPFHSRRLAIASARTLSAEGVTSGRRDRSAGW
jgi:ADP-heptose:LPS heptosyltransferase